MVSGNQLSNVIMSATLDQVWWGRKEPTLVVFPLESGQLLPQELCIMLSTSGGIYASLFFFIYLWGKTTTVKTVTKNGFLFPLLRDCPIW